MKLDAGDQGLAELSRLRPTSLEQREACHTYLCLICKSPQVALIALACKDVTLANAIVRDQTHF